MIYNGNAKSTKGVYHASRAAIINDNLACEKMMKKRALKKHNLILKPKTK